MPRVSTSRILTRCICPPSFSKPHFHSHRQFLTTTLSCSKNEYSTQYSRQISSRHVNSSKFATLFIVSSVVVAFGLQFYGRPESNDALPGNQLSAPVVREATVEVTTTGHENEEVDQIATGTSTVPFFPRKIWLPRSGAIDDGKSRALPAGLGAAQQDEEYQLLGLGIRTVSFLRIQVYVVGLYVAHSDLPKLQERMIHATAAPTATTLVEGETVDLKQRLLDEQGSEKIWGDILREKGLKSALRIVPTRGSDFGHLRDGWVRGITARSNSTEFADDGFKGAVGEFKKIFGGKKLAKGNALLLGRGNDGQLEVWVEEAKGGKSVNAEVTGSRETEGTPGNGKGGIGGRMVRMGGLEDERISRLVWLGYLAGKNVASEGARQSVVEGVMEIVARPIGTVETQVV